MRPNECPAHKEPMRNIATRELGIASTIDTYRAWLCPQGCEYADTASGTVRDSSRSFGDR
jgi:hypothetical protein